MLDAIVLDKTGTITKGEPELTDVVVVGDVPEDELLALTAALEKGSEHPLGEAIVRGAENRNLVLPDASNFAAIPGHGVSGQVGGRELLLGNAKLLFDRGIDADPLKHDWEALAADGKTPMYIAVDNKAAGLVAEVREPEGLSPSLWPATRPGCST